MKSITKRLLVVSLGLCLAIGTTTHSAIFRPMAKPLQTALAGLVGAFTGEYLDSNHLVQFADLTPKARTHMSASSLENEPQAPANETVLPQPELVPTPEPAPIEQAALACAETAKTFGDFEQSYPKLLATHQEMSKPFERSFTKIVAENNEAPKPFTYDDLSYGPNTVHALDSFKGSHPQFSITYPKAKVPFEPCFTRIVAEISEAPKPFTYDDFSYGTAIDTTKALEAFKGLRPKFFSIAHPGLFCSLKDAVTNKVKDIGSFVKDNQTVLALTAASLGAGYLYVNHYEQLKKAWDYATDNVVIDKIKDLGSFVKEHPKTSAITSGCIAAGALFANYYRKLPPSVGVVDCLTDNVVVNTVTGFGSFVKNNKAALAATAAYLSVGYLYTNYYKQLQKARLNTLFSKGIEDAARNNVVHGTAWQDCQAILRDNGYPSATIQNARDYITGINIGTLSINNKRLDKIFLVNVLIEKALRK